VFRDFPLSFHPRAHVAAEAAQCANAQGKFWEYHDALFEHQQALGDDDFRQYATEVGLSVDEFNTCMESGRFRGEIAADLQEGQRMGVRGTPASFVNGRFLSGAQPFEGFARLIDEELELKGTATR